MSSFASQLARLGGSRLLERERELARVVGGLCCSIQLVSVGKISIIACIWSTTLAHGLEGCKVQRERVGGLAQTTTPSGSPPPASGSRGELACGASFESVGSLELFL